MYCRRIDNVSLPINLSLSRRRDEQEPPAQKRRNDASHFEALTWINDQRRRSNELRQTAVTRLDKAKPGQNVELDHLALTELPDFLAERACGAKAISLAGNSLAAIPRAILSFEKLKKLDVSGNELGALSPQISQMTKLRELNVSHNGLSELPDEIGGMSSLEHLNVGDNALGNLPPAVGGLGALKTLRASGNMMKDLPAEIARCTQLQTLDLSRNHFALLPSEIGTLAKLETLNVAKNQLADVIDTAPVVAPDEPAQPRAAARYRAIPESIGRLKSLQRLDVSGNPLATLPNSFGPFEYASKSRLEIKLQGAGTFLSKGIRIQIDNTPLPVELERDGRLGKLTGVYAPRPPVYEPLYSKQLNRAEEAGEDDGEAPQPFEARPQPLAQMAAVMPELLSAYSALGATGADVAALNELLRQAAMHQVARAGVMEQAPPQHARPEHAVQLPQEPAHPIQTARFTPPPSVRGTGDGATFEFKPPRHKAVSTGAHSVFSDSSEDLDDEFEVESLSHVRSVPPVVKTHPAAGTGQVNAAQYSGVARTMPLFGPAPVPVVPAQTIGTQPVPMASTSAQPTPITFAQPMPADPILAGAYAHASPVDSNAELIAQIVQQVANMMRPREPVPPPIYAAPVSSESEEWFDYTEAAFGDPDHQFNLDMMGLHDVLHSSLYGLADAHRGRLYLQDEELDHRVEQAKLRATRSPQPGETLARNLRALGGMMFRQDVICRLAESVAELNKQKKAADPTRSHLIEDPLLIAFVYQTIVCRSNELQIIGFGEMRNSLEKDPNLQKIFGLVVSPEKLPEIQAQIMSEVRRAESNDGGNDTRAFLHAQPFWKEFLESQKKAVAAEWRVRHGFR